MLSPRKPPGASPASPRTAVPLNGLFINNTWRCNCPDRPQAIKLQTKNQGANHGRWFWTCQRQKAHCNFFLWSNDAEVREKQVVLNNGRSESFPSPGSGGVGAGGVSTPTKRMSTITNDERGLLTPQTENKTRDFRTPISAQTRTPYSSKSAGAQMMADDEALEQLAGEDGIDSDESVGSHAAPRSFQDRLNGAGARKYSEAKTESFSSTSSGSPPKTPRTEAITSPGKRKRREQIEDEDAGAGLRTPVKRGPLFSPSPAQSSASSWPKLPPSSAEVCLTPTPTKNPRQSFTVESPSQINTTSLSHEAISLLERQSVVIPRSTQEELVELLDRHELRDKGIVRGRDVTRAALKQRDEEIVKLKEKIAGLERQREMDGAVLRGLRSAGRKSMV